MHLGSSYEDPYGSSSEELHKFDFQNCDHAPALHERVIDMMIGKVNTRQYAQSERA